MSPRKIIVQRC